MVRLRDCCNGTGGERGIACEQSRVVGASVMVGLSNGRGVKLVDHVRAGDVALLEVGGAVGGFAIFLDYVERPVRRVAREAFRQGAASSAAIAGFCDG